ncbi:MAG: glycosyltransferase family 4 protein [Bacteroidaceae bacterium]|nr:glycosyltransferase family 4 protein [Bacteroidaceae bacterium]
MKIGFDAKRLYNNFTGLGNHSRTTIDILTAEYPQNQYILYTPKLRLNPVTSPYLSKEGCHTVQPHGFLRGGLWRTFGLPAALKRDRIDLFHGLSNELPLGIHRTGIPSVVTIHDVAFRTFPDMYHWADRHIYDQKWRYAVCHADRIIAISQCTKQDILRFYDVEESKIDVVYQPVNKRYYEENARKVEGIWTEAPYMLYVGSVNSRKNLLGIVKAMQLLPPDIDLPLYIVGDGHEYKREVKSYIAAHGMESRFRWLGGLTHDELQQLYLHAQLFVYPSFYEGFGLPVVEAMLSGCPVVSSNVSSLPEAAGPYSLLANPASPEDIKEKMLQALTDTALRAHMIQGSRQYAMQTFHPTVLAQQLMSVYHSTCSTRCNSVG